MKSLLKNKIVLLIGLGLISSAVVYAAVSTTVNSAASAKTSVTGLPATSSAFTFVNTNVAANSTVYVYDAPGTNVTYSVGGYSNYVYTTGSITNSWTNYLGVVNSNIYTGLITITNSVLATTNFYPLVGTFVVTSNTAPGLGTLLVNLNYNFRYGILLTNNNAVSATVTYAQ